MLVGSCHLPRTIMYMAPDLDDYKIFAHREVAPAQEAFRFIDAHQAQIGSAILVKPTMEDNSYCVQTLDKYVDSGRTVAMMIIRNDSILYERYSKGYSEDEIVTTFSTAKSFIFTLLGIAIAQGYIGSLDDSVVTYLPEFRKRKGFERLTLRHLLAMRAGLKQGKNAAIPFSQGLTFYYGLDQYHHIKKLKVRYEPNEKWYYSHTAGTAMLGLIIGRATGKQLAHYLSEHIWSRIGTEQKAIWSLDHKGGREKAFCCINARVRDLAKFGRLTLNQGNWNGQQIVPKDWFNLVWDIDRSDPRWIRASKTRDTDYFNYHWWVGTKGRGDFKAAGLYGQNIHIFPKENMIILTFSDRRGLKEGLYQVDLYYDLIDQLQAMRFSSGS